MWIQERQRNNRHDLHSKTASKEMPGTECGPLHDFFVDLTKAFDTVSREGLWKIYGKVWLSCQVHIATVRQFHDGLFGRVQNDGEFSDLFPLTELSKTVY